MRTVHIGLQIQLYFYYTSSNVLYRVELFVCSYVVVVVVAICCCYYLLLLLFVAVVVLFLMIIFLVFYIA